MAFGEDNLHGRPRHTCTLVGECDLGCNEGAKNSLDHTYLSRFLTEGGDRAHIFTCCEATGIEPEPSGGYRVHFAEHRAARAQVRRRRELHDAGAELLDPQTDETSDAWTRTVTAGVVVVAGGTFGSTRLLLASRPRLPRLSAQLGRRFSTNGDLLTVARECRAPDGSPRDLDPTYGPVITAYAEHVARGRRLWMQDAGGPGVSAWAWQALEIPRDVWSARALLPGLIRGQRGGRISRLIARALGSSESSASMLPMLTMGEDVGGGRMRLEGDGLALDWNPRGDSRSYFESAVSLAELFAKGLGGRLGPPLAARVGARPDRAPARRVPHGCRRAHRCRRLPRRGVRLPGIVRRRRLDHARARRAQPQLHHRRDGGPDRQGGTGARVMSGAARPAAMSWSETFRGRLAFGQTDFNQAMLDTHGEAITAGVTVVIPDLARFLAAQADGGIRDPDAMPAHVTEGYVRCDAFGGELRVRYGRFRAFVPTAQTEPRDALHLRMRYELELDGPGGRAYVLEGFKLVENDPGYDSWSDTTTLFIRIRHGDEPVAIGVLQISPLAFMRQLTTFRGSGPTRSAAAARAGPLPAVLPDLSGADLPRAAGQRVAAELS